MNTGSMPFAPPANDAGGGEDVRVELRRDHDAALADLEALRHEKDERRCQDRLLRLRQAWMIHALAEETVIYRKLEMLERLKAA
jgi:hemerythrin superfamily protein